MIIDIGQAPFESLSNFHPHRFTFRNVRCASMEGLLQSLKFSVPEKQLRIVQLSGIEAKRAGQKRKWYLDHTLFWQGNPIDRFSSAYKALIKEAYFALYNQNDEFRALLRDTIGYELTHSIRKNDERYTVLTTDKFISTLNLVRQLPS